MHYRNRARIGPRYSRTYVAVLILMALVVAGALYVGVRMVFAGRPRIALAAPFDVVGRQKPFEADVSDPSGVKRVTLTIRQGEREHVAFEESFDPPRTQVELRWVPGEERRFRLQEGPGTLVVEARNDSWGNFFRGRTATLEKEFTARLVPPRVEVLTTQHYVNQGGCDMVVYRLTPAGASSGVVAGEAYFPGHPMPGGGPGVHFAVFCYPYDAPEGTDVKLRATDEAENEALVGFWLKVFPRKFRDRDIPLDDAFLNEVVPEIMSQADAPDQGSLIKNYLHINGPLRRANNQALAELTSRSRPEFLWTEPFRQLGGSQVEAAFADHRTYVYQGEKVDVQDHLGFDLATTANAPITAANDGVVVKAEYFGIYGNTVVIDHGYGLLSVYGHLASFDVKAGDTVKRGQTVGRTGSTGLAGGDHLHFSIVLQGEQVDAREWWDRHWLEDRIFSKLRRFGALPSPSPSP